jgi:PBSX family phage terminase large subunit
LTWWCKNSPFYGNQAIICDGAVRSGKTLCMSVSFVSWAFYSFSDTSFAMCGKTVTALKRNVILPLVPLLTELGFQCELLHSRNLLEIEYEGRKNSFYLFGGKDEASASLIQGITLGGVLLDEVALMPRSFAEQALARCSLEGARFFFNCNPEHPLHWFRQEWLLKKDEKNACYIHFEMRDNPSLSPQVLKRYETLYSGTFYERFVLGKWVAAQGLVYPFFDRSFNTCKPPEFCGEFYVSCDYGTVNPCSMGLWGESGGVWYRLCEYYHSSRVCGVQKTDEEYYDALCELAGNKKIQAVIVDPSAASFIECIRRHGKFRVLIAKNDVSDGIRRVSDALKGGKIKICECCKDALREFSLYRWEEKGAGDVVRKENDHAMDDIRYFVSTALRETDDFFALSVERGK